MDAIAAKQFLISKVTAEAEFKGTSLSEVERKMLQFTEAYPSISDIYEVSAEFERTCDSDEYEAKISTLLRSARSRDQKQSPNQGQQWNDAVDALKDEDHYILVMVYRAFPEYRKTIVSTHRVRDYIIYLAIGIALVLIAIGAAIWRG
jgi:hypothetical protein